MGASERGYCPYHEARGRGDLTMRWRQELTFIIRRLIHRRRAERELDEEMRAHLEMEIEQNIADGMSPEEARRAALRSFLSVAIAKQDSRAMSALGCLDSLSNALPGGARFRR